MELADFIESSLEAILQEWEAFASTRLPSAAGMDALSLRDHAPQILRAIAADLREPQSATAQMAKAHGRAPVVPGAPHTAAEVHGALRAKDGFSMKQLVSEYRALRSSVLRLWAKANENSSAASIADDVMRFNEAVDQAIAESVEFFGRELAEERTELAAAEKSLQLHRARLEYARRLSKVGFWYCDLPFDVLDWDEQVKEHFFLEPTASVTIDDFYDRIHPDDRDSTRAAIEASIASRGAYDIVYRTRHPATGEVKWIRALGGTGYGNDGAPIHFDGITVDVSAQKVAEMRVAESEATYRSVLSNMDEGFTLFDQDFNILEVNDAACRNTGLARSELIGANHWHTFAKTHDSELGLMYRQVLLDGAPRSLESHYVYADGRAAWYEVRAFRVGCGVAVLFRDVTERHELIERLKAADQRKDVFLATLAHELRNPLAPIRSAVVLAKSPTAEAARREWALNIIERQARHMGVLLEDLLDVSRVSQGKLDLRLQPVALREVVEAAMEAARPLVDKKKHQLSVSLPATPVTLTADPVRLTQILSNLLSNAAKYTDPGGNLGLEATVEDGKMVLRVSDDGIGISAQARNDIFGMFTQVKSPVDRAEGGLGIGLALTRALVLLHGGQLEAHSEGLGRGSKFVVSLPLGPQGNRA